MNIRGWRAEFLADIEDAAIREQAEGWFDQIIAQLDERGRAQVFIQLPLDEQGLPQDVTVRMLFIRLLDNFHGPELRRESPNSIELTCADLVRWRAVGPTASPDGNQLYSLTNLRGETASFEFIPRELGILRDSADSVQVIMNWELPSGAYFDAANHAWDFYLEPASQTMVLERIS